MLGRITSAVSLVILAACGPAPGYVEEPMPRGDVLRAPALPPEESVAACRQAPPLQRLQGRLSRYQSVEGMATQACPPLGVDPTTR